MLVSRSWLSEYIELSKYSDEELAHALTFAGIEVEGFNKFVNCNDLVVGEVIEISKHENADKLSVCLVDVGLEDNVQIVCGASNVDKNKKVIVALPGTKLGEIEIKETTIRDVKSYGMLCSLEELGVSSAVIEDDFKDGIHLLSSSAVPGENAVDFLHLNDTVFDLSLTPNRADCLNILGVAYELSAVLDIPITKRTIEYPNVTNDTKLLNLVVNSDNVNYFSIMPLHDIKIKKSPEYICGRLMVSGIKPINNIVDTTNYVMIEMGQPIHAYDFDKTGTEFEVRNAFKKEEFITLNNETISLTPEDIVVSNEESAIGLGGVIGGNNSKVSKFTNQIVLEAAQFDRQAIRNTSKRFGIRTDSSYRFEKGIDVGRTELAFKLATKLIVENADAKMSVSPTVYIDEDKQFTPTEISISKSKIDSYVGKSIDVDEIISILDKLNLSYRYENGFFYVTTLSRRPDIEYDVCIIEEIIRIYGINNIGSSALKTVDNSVQVELFNKHRLRIINNLVNMGYYGVVNYSLSSLEKASLFKSDNLIRLLNPISSEREYMRTTLLYSLLDVSKYNLDHQNSDLKTFELSQVSYKEGENVKDKLVLAGMAYGKLFDSPMYNLSSDIDFYFVKGTLQKIFHIVNFDEGVDYDLVEPTEVPDIFHPYQVAEIVIDNKCIGYVGKIHPKHSKVDVFAFEIDLNSIDESHNLKEKVTSVSKFPSMKRDLSVLIEKNIPVISVTKCIKDMKLELLNNCSIYNEYIDESFGNYKSVTVRLEFKSHEKTLTDSIVNEQMDIIITELSDKIDAKLR